LPRPSAEKSLAVSLSIELMLAVTLLGERAVRLPAVPDNPGCNAGMSFTTLRDSAALTDVRPRRALLLKLSASKARGRR
jgi:hypothetical protein